MSKKNSPQQLWLPMIPHTPEQNNFCNTINSELISTAKKAQIIAFSSFRIKAETEEIVKEKNMLLNAAQSLKW